jgi:hypothetical protein
MTPARVILEVPRRLEVNAGDAALKRVATLAAAFGRKGEILVV